MYVSIDVDTPRFFDILRRMSPRKRSTKVDPPASNEPEGDELEDEDDAVERAGMGDLLALADATYADWTWHVYRQRSPEDMARTRSRQQSVWVLSITGPLDIAQLRDTVGGGLFTLWGYREGRLQHKIRFEMEGPPRIYTPPVHQAPPAAPAAAPASTPNGTDPVLLALLTGQQKILESIAANLARPQPREGLGFREVIALAQTLGGGGRGVEMKDMVALFQQGIEIGGSAVGGNDKTMSELLVEKGIPALERLAVAMSRNRPVVRQPAAPRPKPASGATVVEDPPGADVDRTPNPEPELTADQKAEAVRWEAAVGALSRAIEGGAEPDDFADTLDDLLLPHEIDLMLAGGAGAVLEQLRTAADRFPVLNTPAAEPFVTAVLASLSDPNPEQ